MLAEFVAHEDCAAVDHEVAMHEPLAVLVQHPGTLDGAKNDFVPIDGLCRIGLGEIGRDGLRPWRHTGKVRGKFLE